MLFTQNTKQNRADRDVLKLTQQEFAGLPFHLAAEVCVGAALALFGGYGLAGTLKPIIVTRGLCVFFSVCGCFASNPLCCCLLVLSLVLCCTPADDSRSQTYTHTNKIKMLRPPQTKQTNKGRWMQGRTAQTLPSLATAGVRCRTTCHPVCK
jgi:hypothetical protein